MSDELFLSMYRDNPKLADSVDEWIDAAKRIMDGLQQFAEESALRDGITQREAMGKLIAGLTGDTEPIRCAVALCVRCDRWIPADFVQLIPDSVNPNDSWAQVIFDRGDDGLCPSCFAEIAGGAA